MLIIFAVRPVAAPDKAMGDKELITEIAGTELMREITFPVGIRFRAGRGDPDIIRTVFYIGNVWIEEGVNVNCHSECMPG